MLSAVINTCCDNSPTFEISHQRQKTILKTDNLAIDLAFLEILLSYSKNLVTACRFGQNPCILNLNIPFRQLFTIGFLGLKVRLEHSEVAPESNFKLSWVRL